MSHYVTIDFETRSEADLEAVGHSVYADHWSTRIQALAWAVDDGPCEGILTPRYDTDCPLPMGADYLYVAHNVGFEFDHWHKICVPCFGWPIIPMEQWRCTAALAASWSLPRSLDLATHALKLDVVKDKLGSEIMKRLASPIPERERKKYGGKKWIECPFLLGQQLEYCKQDVLAERELLKTLQYELSPREFEIWLMDWRINQRGIYCDLGLARTSASIAYELKSEANVELAEITDGVITTSDQTKRIPKFCGIPNCQKETIDAALETGAFDPIQQRVMEIRRDFGKAAVTKYQAIVDRCNEDSRARYCLAYCGAHTGRWTAYGVQPHNLFKALFPHKKIEQIAIPAIMRRDLSLLTKKFGSPMAALQSAIRSTLQAAPGKQLVASDYSAIEPRVLMWLIGDDDALNALRTGDLYKELAAQVLGTSVEHVTKEQRNRIGKPGILGGGYGMGAPRFAAQYELPLSKAKKIISAYRSRFSKVVNYWYECDRKAMLAYKNPGLIVKQGKLLWRYRRDLDCLQVKLPSGRKITYWNPRIGENRFGGECLTHMILETQSKKWVRRDTWGGTLTENIVQGIARDVMAYGMLCAERAGYLIILTVHDEVIAEIPIGFGSVEQFEALLILLEQWAEGCPIKADDGYLSQWYRKG